MSGMTEPLTLAAASPPAMRNRGPIADVLERVLPKQGLVLEIASGHGLHVDHFAERMPGLVFQPSEASAEGAAELDAKVARTNVRPAIVLDVRALPWPIAHADAIVCINMIHASPPEALPALMRGAAATLSSGAPLVTYGPYKIDGRFTSESNESFDQWLKRERHPSWGVRDLEAVVAEAAANGMLLEERIAMPANNFALVFRKA